MRRIKLESLRIWQVAKPPPMRGPDPMPGIEPHSAITSRASCAPPTYISAQSLEIQSRMPYSVIEQEPDEQALMAAYAAGDERAFEALFRALAPRLRAFFRRSISDAALVDDLLQITFVRLHAARDRYRPGSPVRPWLFTIAARARIDELRRRHRRPQSTSDDELERLEAEPDPQQGGLSIDRDARVHCVRDALDALPPAHRMVIHLHRFEELSFAEIGEVLGITAGAARVRAFRAYAVLRERLRPLMQEEA